MKKILSVALVLCMMVSLCSVFALMPVSAAAADEITPGTGWTVTGKSSSVTGNLAGYPNNAYFVDDADLSAEGARTKEEKIADLVQLWNHGVNEGVSIGSGVKADGSYTSNVSEAVAGTPNQSPQSLLTGTSGTGTYWGGYWCQNFEASIPSTKWPITFDVDFDGNITTSGVRLGHGNNGNGRIAKFEVWVQFPDAGEDDWTYICTDGNINTTGNGKEASLEQDIDTPFGQNLVIKKLRIVVLASNIPNGKLAKFKEYNSDDGTGAEYAYFQLSKIAMLKPYNDGGAEYSNWLPTTASSADQLDEYTLGDSAFATIAADVSGAYRGRDASASDFTNAFDGNRTTPQMSNGACFTGWEDEIEVSGIRFYPMSDMNAKTNILSHSEYKGIDVFYALKTFDGAGMGYLTGDLVYNGTRIDETETNKSLTKVMKSGDLVPYPNTDDSASATTDYTKPVTISFGKNVKIKGYMLEGWTTKYGNAANSGFAEVRLLKPTVIIAKPDVTVSDKRTTAVNFKVEIPESLSGVTFSRVENAGGTALATTEATWDNDSTSVVLTGSCIESLDDGTTTLYAVFTNGNKIELTVTKQDVTTQEYWVDKGTGADNLVLTSVNGTKITDVRYSDKSAAYVYTIVEKKEGKEPYNGDQKMLAFTWDDDTQQATVKVYEFRKNLDIFDAYKNAGKVYIDVKFEDDTTQEYTVNLKNKVYTLSAVTGESYYRGDEVHATTNWTVEVSSANSISVQKLLCPWDDPSKMPPYCDWHSGYAASDTTVYAYSLTNIHWLEVNFNEETEVAGLRYERRRDGSSPWRAVTVYGRKKGETTWTEVKSKTTLTWDDSEGLYTCNNSGVYTTTPRWSEAVRWDAEKYEAIRIKINGENHACANGIRFIKGDIEFLESAKTVDVTAIDDVTYSLSVPGSMADYTAMSVTSGHDGASLTANEDYVWNGTDKTITLKKSYVETLGGEGTYSFTLKMGKSDTETKDLSFTLKLTDVRQLEYYLMYAINEGSVSKKGYHGTWNLTVPAVGTKLIKEVAIHEDSYKWVQDDLTAGEKIYTLKTFDPAVSEATVAFNEFKKNIDVFDIMKNDGAVYLLVTFSDDTTEKYTVNLKNESWKFSTLGTIVASNFKYDEIVPTADWTAEFSSSNHNSPHGAFIDKGTENPEHMWHTDYGVASDGKTILAITQSGAQWTEVDFKKDTPVAGVRYTARGKVVDGVNVSNFRAGAWSAVEIWGKKDGDDAQWVKLKDKTTVTYPNATTLTADDFEFTADSYRYIRIKLYTPKSGQASDSGYGCTKYIKFLKPWVKVDGEDTVTVASENEWVFDQTFNFKLIDGATSITKVTSGSTALNLDTDYTVGENCALTLKKSYLSTLAENSTSTLTVEFNNGNTVEIKVTRKSLLSADYKISAFKSNGEKNATEDLYLTAPAGLTATKVVVDGTSIPYEQNGSTITIACQKLRTNMDLYAHYKNGTDAIVNVTFSQDGADKVAAYKLNLSSQKLTFSEYSISGTTYKDNFKSDEIIPGVDNTGDWSVETDSAQNNGIVHTLSGLKPSAHTWHTGYTVVGGTNAITYKDNVRYYFDIDLGESIAFSGIRYYRRMDVSSGTNSAGEKYYYYNTSGLMKNMEIWGKVNESDEWQLLDPADYSFSWKGFTTWKDGQDPADATEYNDAKMDATYKVRYIRLRPIGQGGGHLSAGSIRLLEGTYTEPAATNSPVAMDFELGEDALVKFSPASGLKLTGITTDKGAAIPAEYITLTDDSVKISPYYFGDTEQKSGTVNFKAQFALGQEIDFAVNVGDVEGYTMAYTAGANGTVTAYASNEATGASGVEKASGTKVRNSDKLIFTATPDTGYMVDAWSVESTTHIYEVIADSAKKEWSITTNSQEGNSIGQAINGSLTDYWHSDYGKEYGDSVTSPYPGEIWIKLIFDQPIVDAQKMELAPRTDEKGTHIRNYTLYALPAGCDDADENWVKISADGASLKGYKVGSEFIEFTTQTVKGLKLVLPEIGKGRDTHVYIGEINVYAEKLPTGKVVRTGTGSEDFEIDSRFTDMAVNVTFKPVPAGTAAVATELTYATSTAPASIAHGEDLVFTITANTGYHAPASITVLKDGEELESGKDYTYTAISDTEATVTVKNVSGSSIVVKGTAKDYKNHTVTYEDTLGATGQIPEAVQVIEGNTYTVVESSLYLEGYTFDGWVYDDGTGAEPSVLNVGDTLTMPAHDVTLTAKWTAVPAGSGSGSGSAGSKPSGGSSSNKGSGSGSGGGVGGGTGGVHNVTINGTSTNLTHGSVVSDPAPQEGYVFNGWYLDEALTIPYSNTGVTENVTLYPSWTKERSKDDLGDIKGHWAEDVIGELYEKGVVNGSGGNYKPDDNITRGEFVQILYNLSGMVSDGSHNFSDVKTGDWFSLAVAWAVSFGITNGTSADEFSPYAYITREEIATMIYRYMTLMGADWQTTEEGTFSDSGEIADFAAYQVRWAKGNNIITGRPDGTFGPKDKATRAETAAMVSRMSK